MHKFAVSLQCGEVYGGGIGLVHWGCERATCAARLGCTNKLILYVRCNKVEKQVFKVMYLCIVLVRHEAVLSTAR